MKRSKLLHWHPGFPWEVPRDTPVKLPDGMTYAAVGRMVLMGPERPPQTLKPEDWDEATASQVRALLLVSAVHCQFTVGGTFPSAGHAYARRPTVVSLRPGAWVVVSVAETRTGQLWTFPLRPLIRPPALLITTTHEDNHHGP
ncbi:MAG: hypothetical protein EOP36_18090 [Rubrivivax sp.]|nr:MAG: hypothetical protein EOP36_18090 [Rubrivivax sp.]